MVDPPSHHCTLWWIIHRTHMKKVLILVTETKNSRFAVDSHLYRSDIKHLVVDDRQIWPVSPPVTS